MTPMQLLGFHASMSFQKSSARMSRLACTELFVSLGCTPNRRQDELPGRVRMGPVFGSADNIAPFS